MSSFNKVILMGNITRDIELRYTPKGAAVAKLGLAVNRSWTGEDEVKHDEVTFVDVDCFGKTAETIAQYFAKGKPILLEGRLKLDQWEDKQSGEKRSKLKVVLERFSFVGSKDDAGNGEPQAQGRPPQRGSRPPARSQSRAEAAQPDGGESGYQPDAQELDVPF